MALVTVQRSPTPSTTSSPCVSDSGSGEDDRRSQPRSISESFLTVKGAALFLPRGSSPTPSSTPPVSQRRNKHTGDLQKHLQTMFTVLRPEDTIRLAVRLESAYTQVTRYMVVVSTNGRQDTEESIVLGMDFLSSDSCCTVGLVLPLWSDTLIHLDGDGGFSVSTVNRVHVFKPVSVQAMWSALQSLHKACDLARCHNYYPGSLFLTWISYYQSRVASNQLCVNEWNAMQDVESHRANSPVPFTDLPTERVRTERLITTRLREIMMQKDLENVTCKEIRTELEMHMVCNLREFKEFIDNEMIVILGQMDSPTEIFEHVYLGSEWNASNLEELQNSGVGYILNVTREIDNFFPGMFEYHNIRVYDEEATNLLEYWNETFKFITKAKKAGAKCLVHCKMGVSRSASTVIAYAMKEYGWDLDTAFDHVKDKRAVTKPNPSFMKQLEEYQGILLASKQRHNKLWRSHSDGDLSDRSESMCKPSSRSLGRSDSHNNNTTSSSPSLHHFLGVAVLQALGAAEAKEDSAGSNGLCNSPVQPEDLLLLPLPPPRATTVVPEECLDNSPRVGVTVPVAMPHPPPLLHIVPPTPELQRVHRTPPPTHLSISVPKHKPAGLSLSLHERSSSEEISPLTLGSADSDVVDGSLSDGTSDRLSPANGGPLSLAASDANNNPSEPPTGDGRGEADGSSNHSADSIDFFSAREKFLGLAQDGRTRTLSEPAAQQQRTSTDEEEDEEEPGNGSQVSPLSEDADDSVSPDPSPHHDNGISVRHIVTEIEAISHPASCLPPSTSSSSLAPSSHGPQLLPPEHQEEEAESSSSPCGEVAAHGSSSSSLLSSPPSRPQSPCEWPVGSVRRATEQLEQKLRQEMEMAAAGTPQRTPLHSPGTEHSPSRLSPGSPSAEQPPLLSPHLATERSITQGEITAASAPSTDKSEELTGSRHERERLDPPCSPCADNSQVSESHMLTSSPASTSPLVESSLNTSSQGQNRPQACPNHISVDGVTLQESDTDKTPESSPRGGGCGPDCDARSRLARGSQELQKIQQTLRELQAFLHEGVAAAAETTDREAPEPESPQGPRDAMDTEPGPCRAPAPPPQPDAGPRFRDRRDENSFLEPAGRQRATELEARIRQAGLTPPSLMKRSASLAKLDCLELSADDLSDLDLRPHTRKTSSASHSHDSFPTSPSHHDDTWKKQKVLARAACGEKTNLPLGLSPTPRRCSQEEEEEEEQEAAAATGEREEPEGIALNASRQPGRGHSTRRSRRASAEKNKQRAAAVLYNTM